MLQPFCGFFRGGCIIYIPVQVFPERRRHIRFPGVEQGGRGDGDTHYAGGGLLAKWTNKHNVYTEASVRMGRISDSASNMLRDGAGNRYGYDVHANYYGGHVGVGKIYTLKKDRELDVYGKFFYTRRNSVSFNAAGQYDLDAVSSSLLRVGARYGTMGKKWNWYGGLAYEYQFDGESTGTMNVERLRMVGVRTRRNVTM